MGKRVNKADCRDIYIYLDVTDNFSLSSGGERVTSLSHDLHEVICKVTSSKVQTEDGMRKSIT